MLSQQYDSGASPSDGASSPLISSLDLVCASLPCCNWRGLFPSCDSVLLVDPLCVALWFFTSGFLRRLPSCLMTETDLSNLPGGVLASQNYEELRSNKSQTEFQTKWLVRDNP